MRLDLTISSINRQHDKLTDENGVTWTVLNSRPEDKAVPVEVNKRDTIIQGACLAGVISLVSWTEINRYMQVAR